MLTAIRKSDLHRMAQWLLLSLLFLAVIAWVAPAQIPVIVYKLAMVSLFAHLGYWIDRTIFQWRLTDIAENSLFNHRMQARAIVVGAVILAGAMAL